MKKPISAFLAIIPIAGALIYYAAAGANPDEAPVAEVNGSRIAAKEFKRELERQRASVIDYFLRTYGAEYGKDFWKTDYNGENPEALLKQRALEELVKVKVELELAESKGLIRGTGYDDLIREMEKENKRRRAAVKLRMPVYGPLQLDESAFMNYYLSNLRTELKERLAEEELKPSDKELQQHYEKVKDHILVSEDIIRFEKITVSYKDGGSGAADGKQTAAKLMASARLLLEQGMEMSEAAGALQAGRDGAALRYTQEELNDKTASAYFKSQPVLYAVLKGGLKSGETSAVIDEASEGSFSLVRITETEAAGDKSYEDISGNVRSSYVDAAYTEFIHQLVADAQVIVRQSQYDRMTLR